MPFSRYSTSVKWVLTPNHPRSHFRPVLEWHRPIHVCRRWRQTVLPSPRRLGLYLLYTRGTLVRKNLRRWPVFPIISDYVRHLRYNYNTLSPKDEDDNIVAALEHPDRVRSLKLLVTSLPLGIVATGFVRKTITCRFFPIHF